MFIKKYADGFPRNMWGGGVWWDTDKKAQAFYAWVLRSVCPDTYAVTYRYREVMIWHRQNHHVGEAPHG